MERGKKKEPEGLLSKARLCIPGQTRQALQGSLKQVEESWGKSPSVTCLVICPLASRGRAPSILPLELGANAY